MTQPVTEIHEALRRQILTGELAAGSRLREEQIAASFAVSRTPVREAIRRLEAESLVTLVPHRGAQVREWDAADHEEVFDLRELLEAHAAEVAATSGIADVEALTDLCDRMEAQRETLRSGDLADPSAAYDEITRLNLEFHRRIHLAGGRRLLPELLSGLIEVPLVRRTFHRYTEDQLNLSFAQHRELVAAIAAGDGPWAHAVMTSHLRSSRATYRLDKVAHGEADANDTGQESR